MCVRRDRPLLLCARLCCVTRTLEWGFPVSILVYICGELLHAQSHPAGRKLSVVQLMFILCQLVGIFLVLCLGGKRITCFRGAQEFVKHWRIWTIDSAVQDNSEIRYQVCILALLFESTDVLLSSSSLTSAKVIGQPFVVRGGRRPPSNRIYWNSPLIPCTLPCPLLPSSSLLFLWCITGSEIFCVEWLREGYTSPKCWNFRDF
jgi:hypothetical protein